MAAKVSPSSQDFISETNDGGEVQGPRSESSGMPWDRERMMNDQASTGVPGKEVEVKAKPQPRRVS